MGVSNAVNRHERLRRDAKERSRFATAHVSSLLRADSLGPC